MEARVGRLLSAAVALVASAMFCSELSAASFFDLTTGRDRNNRSVNGVKKFVLRDGGVNATFYTPRGSFVTQAINRPRLRGLGVNQGSRDTRPRRLVRARTNPQVIQILFSRPVTLGNLHMVQFAGTNLNRVRIILRGGGQVTRINGVGVNPVDLSGLGNVRRMRIVYVGKQGGIRLRSLEALAVISGDPLGPGDDNGVIPPNGNGNGNGDDPFVVPLPSSAWAGLALLTVLGLVYAVRQRRRVT